MIFVLDNYDSFTYNLVHLLYALGAEVTILPDLLDDVGPRAGILALEDAADGAGVVADAAPGLGVAQALGAHLADEPEHLRAVVAREGALLHERGERPAHGVGRHQRETAWFLCLFIHGLFLPVWETADFADWGRFWVGCRRRDCQCVLGDLPMMALKSNRPWWPRRGRGRKFGGLEA